jgi:hypothetical protein
MESTVQLLNNKTDFLILSFIDRYQSSKRMCSQDVSKSLSESANNDTEVITKDYILIICNNIERNSCREVFNNTISFVNVVNYTNIILLHFPFRYDVMDSSYVINKIKSLKRMLLRYILAHTTYDDGTPFRNVGT